MGFRRQALYDGTLPNYAGDLGVGADPALVAHVREADLVLAIGTRLGEAVSQGYTLFDPAGGTPIVHVHQDPAEIGRVFRPQLGIAADLNAFCAAAAALPANVGWHEWTETLRATRTQGLQPPEYGHALNVATVMRELEGLLAPDAVCTCDAGNFAGWPQRFIDFGPGQRFLGPTNGAMGYSVPAAVGAKIAFPDRMVVAFVGDGGFMMTGQEIATAFHHGVAPDRDRVQQPDVRHHPHVSGAQLPRPRVRHGADQPRLRQADRGVRRPWRDGERDGAVRRRVPPGGGQRPAGDDRAGDGPGADHQPCHGGAAARRHRGGEAGRQTREQAAAPGHPAPARQAVAALDGSVPAGRSVTRTLLPFTAIIFLGYAAVGLPLATLPLLVHGLGFGTTIVGVVIGLAPVATLLTRQLAGQLADRRGPKFGVLLGLATTACSGVAYLLASVLPPGPALAALMLGRVVLGLGDSLFTTACNTWMVTAAGPGHAGRAMSWAGIAMYGALAVGAPLGALLGQAGFAWVAVAVAVSPLLALPMALRLVGLAADPARRAGLLGVVGRMWPPGLGLVLASGGFGTIAAFLALRFATEGWPGGGLALTAFGAVYIVSRLLFAGLPDRLGGVRVAVVCLAVEACGLVLIGLAGSPLLAVLGTALTGLGYSMVFPSLGVEVVRRVSAQDRGVALGAYLACFDLGLGAAGPVMGLVAAGHGLAWAFLAAAGASVLSLGLVWGTRVRG